MLHHESQLRWLEADRDPRALRVWLKLDTGMHRLGLSPEERKAFFQKMREERAARGEAAGGPQTAASRPVDAASAPQRGASAPAATPTPAASR